jgi:mediator of RNA polymerase II transcription subunit 19
MLFYPVYTPSKPSAKDNLTQLYGLSQLAASVARFNPVTGEKHKLRKSYKNQINDLPGKHEIPPEGVEGPVNVGSANNNATPSLLSIVMSYQGQVQNQGAEPSHLQSLDPDLVDKAFVFDKTPSTGIPDFDPAKLAVSLSYMNGGGLLVNRNNSGGIAGSASSPPGRAGGTGVNVASSLLYGSRSHFPASDSLTVGESSNDDSTNRFSSAQKKKKKRNINSLSPSTSGSSLANSYPGSATAGAEVAEFKKRKVY